MFPVANTRFPIRFYFIGTYSLLPGDMCLSVCGWISTGSPSWRGLKFSAPRLEYVRYLACRCLIFPWRPVMIFGFRRFADTCNGLLVCLFIVGGTGLTSIPSWGVSQKSYWTREGAWPSCQHTGFAIRQSWFQVPLWPLAGFFLCCPKFKFLAMLVNSQPVASFQLEFLFLLCSIWIICF